MAAHGPLCRDFYKTTFVGRTPATALPPALPPQIKTDDALPLVRYSCSPRIIPVPTNKVNARRYVRLLHNPIATVFSRNLMDFCESQPLFPPFPAPLWPATVVWHLCMVADGLYWLCLACRAEPPGVSPRP